MNENEAVTFIFTSANGWSKKDTGNVNRGELFGDGLFETMVFWKNRIRFSKEHQQRLSIGSRQLKILPSGLTVGKIEEFIQRNYAGEPRLRVRWNVIRAGLGKYTPLSNHSDDLIWIQPWSEPTKIKNNGFVSNTIFIPPSPWSHCKTLNGLAYVMANIERQEMGMDEVILLDQRGNVSEAGSANIFWVRNDIFYTPAISSNCIAGVGRKKIIETLRLTNSPLIEGEFSVEELLAADQVFTSNVTGIAYLAHLENRSYNTTPLPMVERVFE